MARIAKAGFWRLAAWANETIKFNPWEVRWLASNLQQCANGLHSKFLICLPLCGPSFSLVGNMIFPIALLTSSHPLPYARVVQALALALMLFFKSVANRIFFCSEELPCIRGKIMSKIQNKWLCSLQLGQEKSFGPVSTTSCMDHCRMASPAPVFRSKWPSSKHQQTKYFIHIAKRPSKGCSVYRATCIYILKSFI